MGEVHLHAIGIDEVRDLFSGHPDAAARLATLASGAFPAPEPVAPAVGLLSKLGPMLARQPGAPVVLPGIPTGRDLDALVHGRELPPERRSAGWALVRLWLDDLAWGHLEIVVDETQLNELDFELCRGGVDTRLALRSLFNDRLAIPVKPPLGLVSGYVRGAQGRAMATAWQGALRSLAPAASDVARPVAAWLGHLDEWTAQALDAGRPAPDLVATWQASPGS